MGRRNRRKDKWDEGGHWGGHAVGMVYTPPASFPVFWFEGNQAWGEVRSPEDVDALVQTHVRAWGEDRRFVIKRLMQARINDNSSHEVPDFGFYAEHRGHETLGAYLERHGIRWPLH